MLFFVNNQYLCFYYLLSPTINIERQKMENAIKPTKAYVSNRFIKKSISRAYKEFNNAPKISIKNYATKNNIDIYDAQSLDLNDDNYIDLSERASQICAQKLLKTKNSQTGEMPTMILSLVQDRLGLKKAQNRFLQANHINNHQIQSNKHNIYLNVSA